MSRHARTDTIQILKVEQNGGLPGFLPLIHRHFEKSLPTVLGTSEATLVAPLDLLNMMIPPGLLDNIESIEITYRKGKR